MSYNIILYIKLGSTKKLKFKKHREGNIQVKKIFNLFMALINLNESTEVQKVLTSGRFLPLFYSKVELFLYTI